MIRNVDFDRELEDIGGEVQEEVADVIDSGWFVLGDAVDTFETRFADYVGVDHGIGVNSGTDALKLSLRALGVSSGDEVLTVSHTAIATSAAIKEVGAQPVYVDINEDTMLLDVEQMEEAITDDTAAIVPVHLYGQPVDMEPLEKIAEEHRIPVVEDCSQAHGAEYRGKKVGSFGTISVFSLYPTKNLGAYGDGGIVVTNDAELAKTVRQLRQYGWSERYRTTRSGVNSRLDEIQAKIVDVKLDYLDEWNERRRELAAVYDDGLAETEVRRPDVRSDSTHVFHQYVVRSSSRDALSSNLQEKGIQTGIHYPLPNHTQPGYRQPKSLPVTEEVCSQVMSLPLHPYLSEEEVKQVVEEVRDL